MCTPRTMSERKVKKCPRCKLDKWADEFKPSGYCAECTKVRGRLDQARRRNQDREGFNKYHREYGRKRGHSGRVRMSQHGGGGT